MGRQVNEAKEIVREVNVVPNESETVTPLLPLGRITIREDAKKTVGIKKFMLIGKADQIGSRVQISPSNVEAFGVEYPDGRTRQIKLVTTETGESLPMSYASVVGGGTPGILVFQDDKFVPIEDSKVINQLFGSVSEYGTVQEPGSMSAFIQEFDGGKLKIAPLKPLSENVVTGLTLSSGAGPRDYTLPYNKEAGAIDEMEIWRTDVTASVLDWINVQAFGESRRVLKYPDGTLVMYPFTSVGSVKFINKRNGRDATFKYIPLTLLHDPATSYGTESTVKPMGYLTVDTYQVPFNKIGYTENILASQGMGYRNIIKYLFADDAGQEAEFFSSMAAFARSVDLTNSGPTGGSYSYTSTKIDQRSAGTTPGGTSPATALVEYIRKYDKPQQSTVVAQIPYNPPRELATVDVSMLHKTPEKTFIQRAGGYLIGAMVFGFGAAYYAKNKVDFESTPMQQEEIKNIQTEREIIKENHDARQQAIQEYQEGVAGLQAAEKIDQDQTDELLEKLNQKI